MEEAEKNADKFFEGVRYLSLAHASIGTPYSQEYLSLLSRLGKLPARKIGRNWFVTKDTIDEYVSSHIVRSIGTTTDAVALIESHPIVKNEIRENISPVTDRHLSLTQAAKGTPYSQEYLSLLARRGKLFARKIGRNWYVTRNAVARYLNTHGNPYASGIPTPTQIPTMPKGERPLRPLLSALIITVLFLSGITVMGKYFAAQSPVSRYLLSAIGGSLTPTGAPAGTMHSLTEIYDSIAGSFNSGPISANRNGSLIENLKYIESNLGWASGSNNIWNLNSGNVGIGTISPDTKLEVAGLASVSSLTVGGVAYNPGTFFWKGLSVSGDGGTFSHISSLTFGASGFSLAKVGSLSTITLDYTNGPASRSIAQTITGPWTFTGGASFSSPVEISGTASVSQLRLAGTLINATNFRPSSNSLNWDEFSNALILDATTTTALNGYTLTFGGLQLQSSNASVSGIFESAVIKSATINSDTGLTLAPASGLINITGRASVSSDFEVEGNASASATFGSGLISCSGAGQKLLWNSSTGHFSCGVDLTSSGGSAIGLREGFTGTFTNSSSISLNSSQFDLDFSNLDARFSLDWGIGGPASRALANTWTALNTFSGGASVSSLVISGTAFNPGSYLPLTGGTLTGTLFGTNVSLSSNLEVGGYASLSNSLFANNGNVGIGTSNPTVKLDVVGAIRASTGGFQLAGSGLPTITNAAGNHFRFGMGGGGAVFDLELPSISTYVGFDTNGTHLSLIPSGAGNVGIGTTNPTTKFQVVGAASISSNFEVSGTASASSTFGSGLTTCSGSSFLQYNSSTGLFSCTAQAAATQFVWKGLSISGDNGAFSHMGSLTFDAGGFSISKVGSLSTVTLDYTNGPASRSIAQTITGPWTFTNASNQFSNTLEIKTASISSLTVGGVAYNPSSIRPASNSLDFDELVNSMTVDAPTTINALAGLTFSNASVSGRFEVPGTASLSNVLYTANGKVGIGTVVPNARLEVSTGQSLGVGAEIARFAFDTTSNRYLRVRQSGSTLILDTTAADMKIGPDGGDPLSFQTSAITRMRIDATTGFVGIGTTAPSTKLEVQGTASASYGLFGALQVAGFSSASYSRFGTATTTHSLSAAQDLLLSGLFEVNGNAFFDANASVSSNFEVSGTASVSSLTVGGVPITGGTSGWTDDGTAVRLSTSTDSVGVGTATPDSKLDVAGNILASSSSSIDLTLHSTSETGANQGAFTFRSAGASERLDILNNTTSLVSVASTGSVGIGTNTFTDNVGIYKAVVKVPLGTAGLRSGGLFITTSQAQSGDGAMLAVANFGKYDSTGTALNANIRSLVGADKSFANQSANLFTQNAVAAPNLSLINQDAYTQNVGYNNTSGGFVNNRSFYYVQTSGTSNVYSAVGFQSTGQFAVGGENITTLADYQANNFQNQANATIGTRYGLQLSFDNTGTTNAYGVYQSGTGVKNYFRGFTGIGTVAPSTLLEVKGTSSASYGLFGALQVAGFSSTSYSRFGTATTTHSLSAAQDLLLSGLFETDGNAFFDANASVSGKFEVSGTASVSSLIVGGVAYNPSGYLPLTGGTLTGALVGTTASFSTAFEVGGYASLSNALYAVNGKVGIGNTVPAYRLDVVGTAGVVAAMQATVNTSQDRAAGLLLTNLSGATGIGGLSLYPTQADSGGYITFGGTPTLANGTPSQITSNAAARFPGAFGYFAGTAANTSRFYFMGAPNGTTQALTETVSILNNGNVGIGTINADAKFEVAGTASVSALTVAGVPITGAAFSSVSSNFEITGNNRLGINAGGSTDSTLEVGGIASISGNAYFAGNVGIGTTSPGAKLGISDISNNGGGGILLSSGTTPSKASFQSADVGGEPWAFFGNNMYIDSNLNILPNNAAKNSWGLALDGRASYNLFKLMYQPISGSVTSVFAVKSDGTLMLGNDLGVNPVVGSAKFVINSSGYVGIGTTAPTTKLQVVGAASISSNFEVSGTASVSSLIVGGVAYNPSGYLPLTGGTLSGTLFGTNASLSGSFEAALIKSTVIGSDAGLTLAPSSGLTSITGRASVSSNFEVSGTASSSALFGSGLTTCSGSSFLQYNSSTGLFSCTAQAAATQFVWKGLSISGDNGAFSHMGSLTFDAGGFSISKVGSLSTLTLDYVNGPASRSTANTWSALNTFAAGASVSTNLEVGGYASLSNTLFARNGNVGIGTTSPNAKLSIAPGSTNLQSINLFDSNYGIGIDGSDIVMFTNAATGISFKAGSSGYNGTSLMRILGTGNVGIGTTTPTTKLQVVGNASVSQKFEVSGTASVSSLFVGGIQYTTGNTFAGLLTHSTPGAITPHITDLTFDDNAFNFSNTASAGTLKLDWVNGPASRSTANTWTALNTFTTGASVSNALEVAGTASISGTVRINTGTGGLTLRDPTDSTKTVTFVNSANTTGTNRVITWANASYTPAGQDISNTWAGTNTFNGSTIATGANYYAVGGDVSSIGGIGAHTNLTPDGPIMITGTAANSWHFEEVGDYTFDFNNGPCGTIACIDPTFIVHSHNQTTTQWISVAHSGTNGVIDVGTGRVSIPDGAIFGGSSSVSANLEVSGTASVSSLVVGGVPYTTGGSTRPSSNSLDFDEFIDSMTVDAPTTINAVAGLTFSNASVSGKFEVGGTASLSNTLFVQQNGNVGIASSSPSSTLSIKSSGNNSATKALTISNSSNQKLLQVFNDTSVQVGSILGATGIDTMRINYYGGAYGYNGSLAFWDNSGVRARITSTIVASNPGYSTLDISLPTSLGGVTTEKYTRYSSGFTSGGGSQGQFIQNYFKTSIAKNELLPLAMLHVQANTGSVIPLIVQGSISQTANLTEWRNSAGIAVASISGTGNFEVSGVASVSSLIVGGVPYTTGSAFAGLLAHSTPGASTPHINDLLFDDGAFNFTNTASAGTLKLDYTNGPASRSIANTWSALNTFSAGASVATAFEVSGTASVSSLTVNGVSITGATVASLSSPISITSTTASASLALRGNTSTNTDGSFKFQTGTAGDKLTILNGLNNPIFKLASLSGIQVGGSGVNTNVQIGSLANAANASTGGTSVAIGNGATIGSGVTGSVAIGSGAQASSFNAVALGISTSAGGVGAIAIGNGSTAITGQFVAGSTNGVIGNVFFGSGVTSATPTSYTINGTGGSGADIAGGNVTLAGGKGTGTGLGGSLLFQTAPATTTSSTPNTLTTRLTIDQNGRALFANNVSVSAGFEASGTASVSSLIVGGVPYTTGSAFAGLLAHTTPGATTPHINDLLFDDGAFNFTNTASAGTLKLDYTNGPASRSIAQTITGPWTFTNASNQFSNTLEIRNASVSSLTLNGTAFNPAAYLPLTGGTLTGNLFGTNTSLSGSFESALIKSTTIGSDAGLSLAPSSGLTSITGRASISSNLEVAGTASVSSLFGSGLSTCSGSSFLQYNSITGQFSCTAQAAATQFVWKGLSVSGDNGTLTHMGSLTFDAGGFNISKVGSLSTLTLDYTNGPASRSIAQTISGPWTFTGGASVSNRFEVSGTASVSSLTVNGVSITGAAIASLSSPISIESTTASSSLALRGNTSTNTDGSFKIQTGTAGDKLTILNGVNAPIFKLASLSGLQVSGGGSNTNVQIGSIANVANAGTGGTSVVIGNNAVNSGNGVGSTLVGSSILNNSTGSGNTAVGLNSVIGGASQNIVIVGANNSKTFTGTSHVLIGNSISDSNTGVNNILIGNSLTLGGTGSNTIAIGAATNAGTMSNVFVAGGATSGTWQISNVFFGSGITDTNPTSYTINGTGGSGADIAGGNVTLAGGKGTGTGLGGSLLFQTAPATTTSSTPNTLTTRLTIDQNGRALFANNVSVSAGFEVGGTASVSSLIVGGVPYTTGSAFAGLLAHSTPGASTPHINDLLFDDGAFNFTNTASAGTLRLDYTNGPASRSIAQTITGPWTFTGGASVSNRFEVSGTASVSALTVNGVPITGAAFSSVSTNFEITGNNRLGINAGVSTDANLEVGGIASVSILTVSSANPVSFQGGVALLQNSSGAGRSALLFQDDTGNGRGAVGYGNSAAGGYGDTVFLESDTVRPIVFWVNSNPVAALWALSGASFSTNFEAVGYASASKYFGASLSPCTGSSFLQWTGGLFGCGTPTSGNAFSGIGVREGTGTFAHITSLSFSASGFNISNTASNSSIALDYTNGPASRSIAQTITGLWTFSGGASVSNRFEVSGTASVSSLFVGGVAYNSNTSGWTDTGSNVILSTTTDSVGVGSTTPERTLDVGGSILASASVNGQSGIAVANYSTGTGAIGEMSVYNTANVSAGTDALRMLTMGTGYTSAGGFQQDSAVIDAESGLLGGLSIMTRANAPIRFYYGGGERARIDSSGYGIGETTPERMLDVGGNILASSSANGASGIVVTNPNTGTGAFTEVSLYNTSSINGFTETLRLLTLGSGYTSIPSLGFLQDSAVIDADSGLAGGLSIVTRANAPIRFYPNSTESVRFDTNGFVGIGATTPEQRLEVGGNILASSSGAVDLTLNNKSQTYGKFVLRSMASPNAGRLDILGGAAGASTLMSIASSGNIGIGTTNIDAKLEVSGTASVSSLIVGGIPYTGSTRPSSNSLDFDEFIDSMTVDAPTTINAVAGLTFSNASVSGKFEVGGTASLSNTLFVQQNGNVGIASSSPSSTLSIRSGGNTSATKALSVTNTSNWRIFQVFNDGSSQVGSTNSGSGLDMLRINYYGGVYGNNSSLAFWDSNGVRARITSTLVSSAPGSSTLDISLPTAESGTTTQIYSRYSSGFTSGGSSQGQFIQNYFKTSIAKNELLPLAMLHVRANTGSVIPLIVQGSVSQTANLTEWRNSAGVAIASISGSGNLEVSGIASVSSLIVGGVPYTTGSTFAGLLAHSTPGATTPHINDLLFDDSAFNFTNTASAGTLKLDYANGPASRSIAQTISGLWNFTSGASVSNRFEVSGTASVSALTVGGVPITGAAFSSVSTNFEITGNNRLGINAGASTESTLEVGGTASVSNKVTANGQALRPPDTVSVCASDSLHKQNCDYVADGTGDQVEIQAAINYIVANAPAGSVTGGVGGKGKIVLAGGTYSIASTINMEPGITLQCEGAQSTKLSLASGANTTMFGFNESSENPSAGFIIDGCWFDGNSSGNTSGTAIDTKTGGGTVALWDLQIFNSFFFDFDGDVIVVDDPWGFRFDNNHIENTFARGIVINVGAVKSEGAIITNNKIVQNTDSGIYINNADATIISNNEFNAIGAGNYAVEVVDGNSTIITSNKVWFGTEGILVGASTVGTNVSNNVLGALSGAGITIQAGAYATIVTNNSLAGITGAEIANGGTVSRIWNNTGDDSATTINYSRPETRFGDVDGTDYVTINTSGQIIANSTTAGLLVPNDRYAFRSQVAANAGVYFDAVTGGSIDVLDISALDVASFGVTGGPIVLTPNSGLLRVIGTASISTNFEASGYASASKYFGASLAPCTGSSFLQWTGGLFGCGTPTSGNAFSGIGVREGTGTFAHITSLSFSASGFNISNTASNSSISLDWVNGPASRSIAQTISGLWTFSGGASVSNRFEVSGVASVSSLFVGGVPITGAAFSSVSTNFEITGNNRLGINAGASTESTLEVGGVASISGNTYVSGNVGIGTTTPSARLTVNMSNIGATSTNGIILQNPTAASAGNQQYSPALRFIGQGWKGQATAASQQVEMRMELVPSQTSVSIYPQATLRFIGTLNGVDTAQPLGICVGGTANGAYQGLLLDGTTTGCGGDSDGWAGLGPVNAGNVFGAYNNGGLMENFNVNGILMTNTSRLMWDSANAQNHTTGDVAIGRNAAGVLEINSSTTGQFRDLIARTASLSVNLEVSGTASVSSLIVGGVAYSSGGAFSSVSTNFEITGNKRLGINAGGSTDSTLEVGGIASLSGDLYVNGNVGIGTTTPGAKLEVKGSGTGNVLMGVPGAPGVNYGAISLNGSLAGNNYNFSSGPGDTSLYINRPSNKNIDFKESGITQMLIEGISGNVGIGTVNLDAKFEVSGTASVSSLIVGGVPYTTGGTFVGLLAHSTPGATTPHINDLLFDDGAFNFTNTASAGTLKLDYTNGPASRSATQSITGEWTFNNDVNFQDNNITRFTFASTSLGRFGFGDTTPETFFEIASSSGIVASISNTFYVDATNHRVGIGTSAPASAFEMTGDIMHINNNYGELDFGSSRTSNRLTVDNDTNIGLVGKKNVWIGIDSDNSGTDATFGIVRNDNLLDGSETPLFVVDEFGRVGIGTTLPSTKLEVQGTASASYGLFGSLQVAGFSSTSYSRFGTSTTTRGDFTNGSSVLISGGLQVNGNASISSKFEVSGVASVSSLFVGGVPITGAAFSSVSTNFEITGNNRLGINAGASTESTLEVGGTASVSSLSVSTSNAISFQGGVATLQNSYGGGRSAIRFLDDVGNGRGAVGFGNSAAGGYGDSVFLESDTARPIVFWVNSTPIMGLQTSGTSTSFGFETTAYASASKYFGATLTPCTGSSFLQWSGGLFGCATPAGGAASSPKGIQVAEGTVFTTHFGSVSFDPGMFNISAGPTASATYVRLDWANGPASRAAANTWSALNTFSAGASVSTAFEVSGTASISKLQVGAGAAATPTLVGAGALTTGLWWRSGNTVDFSASGVHVAEIYNAGTTALRLAAATALSWSSTGAANQVEDVGIARTSAGTIKITNGSTGTGSLLALNASLSSNFEVSGTASVSSLFVGGVAYSPGGATASLSSPISITSTTASASLALRGNTSTNTDGSFKIWTGNAGDNLTILNGVNTPLFKVSSTSVVAIGSTRRFVVGTTNITTSIPFLSSTEGTVAAPVYGISGSSTRGMYSTSSGNYNGLLFGANALQVAMPTTGASAGVGVFLQSAGRFGISSNALVALPDVILSRAAAATWQLGDANAAAPVNQVLQAQGGLGSNIAGANLTIAAGIGTGTGIGGSLLFQTSPVGATGAVANGLLTRMAITTTGKVGIGSTVPADLLHIASTGFDGNILRLEDSDGTCDHNPEAGSEVVTCSSDERLKTNIQDAPSAVGFLAGYRIRDFTVRTSGDRETGVVAQELQETHPEEVLSTDKGLLAVQQPNPWVLVKAIQELNTKIDAIGGTTTLTPSPSASPSITPTATPVGEVPSGVTVRDSKGQLGCMVVDDVNTGAIHVVPGSCESQPTNTATPTPSESGGSTPTPTETETSTPTPTKAEESATPEATVTEETPAVGLPETGLQPPTQANSFYLILVSFGIFMLAVVRFFMKDRANR